jgi:Tfp pilus assembly protein PilF
LHPTFADGYVHRGLAYFDLEEFPRAVADFSVAIGKSTKQKSVYRFRGLAYMRMGDKVRAQKDLDHFADEEISSAHFESGLENALKSQGRDTADGLIAKGLKAEETKAVDDAIRYFSLAIKQDRHNPTPYKFRAHAYETKGDFKKAHSDYDMVLFIEPFDANVLVKRAAINERQGNIEKAFWDLNRAISADPVLADAFFAKAALCTKIGKKQDAQLNYQRFIKVALLSTDKGNNAKLDTAMKALGKVAK